jgi:hypothetical protein
VPTKLEPIIVPGLTQRQPTRQDADQHGEQDHGGAQEAADIPKRVQVLPDGVIDRQDQGHGCQDATTQPDQGGPVEEGIGFYRCQRFSLLRRMNRQGCQ